ncbi:T9SS type A sorting domain-containing protein [Bacteroidota bacterium]
MKIKLYKIFISLLLLAGVNICGFSQTIVNLSVNQPEQIQAYAGEDTTICIGRTIRLNGSVIGGDPSYLYLWEPAFGLDDPTSAQPNANPSVSINYLLTVIDSHNCTATSRVTVFVDACTGINEIGQKQSFDLFPNPNNGDFFIEASSFQSGEKIEIRVLNIFGQLVYENNLYADEISSSFQISIGTQERGTYIIQLRNNNQVMNKRFNIM